MGSLTHQQIPEFRLHAEEGDVKYSAKNCLLFGIGPKSRLNRKLNKTQLISQSLSVQISTLFTFKHIQNKTIRTS